MMHPSFHTTAERRLLAQRAQPEGMQQPQEQPESLNGTLDSMRQEALKYVQQFYAAPGFQNVYQQYGPQGVESSMYMYMQSWGYPVQQQMWGGNTAYPMMYYGQFAPQMNPYMQFMPMYGPGMPPMQSYNGYPPVTPPSGRTPNRYTRPGSSIRNPNYYRPNPNVTSPRIPNSTPTPPPSAPGVPEVTSGVLGSTEILSPTSTVGIKFPGPGGVQQSVYINSRTLALEPSNANALLTAAGVRVYPQPWGDIHTFRIQFTRPGTYQVGTKDRMERNPYQWETITVAASSTPGIAPRSITPPNAGPTTPNVAPGGGYNRVEYSDTARSFIQTRLDWVRDNAENPEATYRRIANVYLNTARLDQNIDRTADGITLKRVDPAEHGRKYAIEVNEGGTSQRWYIAEAITRGGDIVFQNANDLLMQGAGPATSFFSNPGIQAAAIRRTLEVARKRRASESADAANVRNFDLPRGESVLYTGVFDRTDPTEENHARHFGSFLGSRGYNIVGSGNDTFPATTNLLGSLEARFDAALRAGIKNHYLYFSVHGSGTRISFGTPEGRSLYLEPQQLMNLFTKSKYSDCRFVLRMNCCNSGGFRSGEMASLFRAGGESGRISVFIQTKPELPNPIRTTGTGRDTNYDTPYDYYLVHFLSQGMTYGQAHVAADEATKRAWPGLDAGVFRTTPTGGVETASFRPGDLPPLPDIV